MALPVASSGCVGINSSHSCLKALENPLFCISRVSFGWDSHPPCVPLKGRYVNFLRFSIGFTAHFPKCRFLSFLGMHFCSFLIWVLGICYSGLRNWIILIRSCVFLNLGGGFLVKKVIQMLKIKWKTQFSIEFEAHFLKCSPFSFSGYSFLSFLNWVLVIHCCGSRNWIILMRRC